LEPTTTLLLLNALVKYGPTVTRALVAIFHKADPTEQDWLDVLNIIDTPLHKTN